MAAMVNMNSLLNGKDSRWLQLEVCREFQRNKCSRQDTECKFAHPPANVEVQNGKVTACYDSIKGRCNRDKPPCKYFHPPQHLKDQLLINGRNHLALKNALMQQMGIAPGQPVIPGQVPTVATNPYLTGIPANTYSPYFGPGHLVPTILGPDPSSVASQLAPVVPQAVSVAQQKIPRSDRLETAPVSAATLTHPIPTPGAPPPPNAVTIGHPLEVGKKRVAENDMFQLMDVKTVGSFYYENFAFSGMVPYKRPAGEKSGIPVYQPGATTYQQLMQLQQPFVPVSCEYQSQNPSATTAIPQPQTSTTANPIIANNNTNNHLMINNNSNFILNNFNHSNNNNKTNQVNLNTVHNSFASNGILNNNNQNDSAVIETSSINTQAVIATKISNSNNSDGVVVINSCNNVYALNNNNNNSGSNTSDSPLANSTTNNTLIDSSPSAVTVTPHSFSTNTPNASFSSTSPTESPAVISASPDTTLSGTVSASVISLPLPSNNTTSQASLTIPHLSTSTSTQNSQSTEDPKETNLKSNDSDSIDGSSSSSNVVDALTTVTKYSSTLANVITYSNVLSKSVSTSTPTFPVTSENHHLKNSMLKFEQSNDNMTITTTAPTAEVSFPSASTPSITYSTSTPNRLYSNPHSFANVIVSQHGYTPVSSVVSSAVPIPYSTSSSAYSYATYPTQSYPSQSYQTQCYPSNSYYADAATVAKEVAQKNYANAVKMAAASNVLSGKPLTAAINYTGLPLNKTYVAQNQAAAAAAFSHHQHQHAAAAAAAQAAQVASLRIGSHTVSNSLGASVAAPVSTPSLLSRPPTGYLQASQMIRTPQMQMQTATASNHYAAAAAAAVAAANQQYLQQQHFFYPGVMAGYPYPMAAAGVPGLTSGGTMSNIPTQMQAAQIAQMNQAAAAAHAAQASAQGSAVVLNPYKKMKTS